MPLLVGRLHPEHRPAPPGARGGFGVPSSSCREGDSSAQTVGVTSLVVTGTMTDICVLATVVGAFNREYRMTVVEDGVARVASTKEIADHA